MVIFLYFWLFIFQNSWLFFLYLIARFYHFEHFDLCINLLITDFKEKLCIKKRKVILQQRKFLFEIIVVSWMSNKNCYHGEQHVKKMDNWHILNNSRKNSNFSARFYPQKFSSFWTLDTAEFDRMNSKRYIATKNTMEDQINFDFLFLIKFNSFI